MTLREELKDRFEERLAILSEGQPITEQMKLIATIEMEQNRLNYLKLKDLKETTQQLLERKKK